MVTDLVDELTEADLAAMWMSRPNRSAGAAPWFPNPFAGLSPEGVDSPFDVPVNSQPEPEVEGDVEPLGALEGRITSLAARLAVQTREWLRLVAEFDRRKGWVQWGMRSMAHWLSWSCSVGPGVAREYVRVANALTVLPLVDAAFGQGVLSYSKVRAVTRVVDRVDERTLLEQASTHSAAQLERVVRAYRKADRVDRPVVERRRARWFFDDDGMLVVSARLTADEGALFVAAVEQARTGELEPGGCPGEAADPARLSSDVDALVALVGIAQAAGPVDSSGDDRHLVVVHADAAVLAGEAVLGAGPAPGAECRIEHGPGLTAQAALRLACDAALVVWVSSAVNPGERLGLGRKTRRISVALRRALRFRDGGCQFPGCSRKRFLDAHHVVHWAQGGPTDLRNLLLLCQRHHRAVHEDGFTLHPVPDQPGGWVFHRPDGTPVPAAPTPEPVSAGTSEWVFDPADDPDPDSLRPAQHGEPFSLRDSVDVFCRNQFP